MRAALARDRERLAGVVELADADRRCRQPALVLEPAEVQGEQHPLAELDGHVGELGLGELVGRQLPAEDLALAGVGDRRSPGSRGPRPARRRRSRTGPRSGRTAGPTARRPGSIASAGSRTPSSTSSAVTEARSDILCLISGAVKPGVSVGTTKPRTPSSVRAQTTATSATEPLVIHILVPVEHPVAAVAHGARVRMPPGSEPKSGSVSPKQPIASPAAIRGSHCVLLLRPSRASRSRTSPASPAPRRSSAARSRRPRAPGRPGRTPWRWCRRSRSPQVHAEQPELAELQGQVAHRHLAALVPAGDLGSQPVVDERAHRVADRAVLVGDQRVGVEQGERRERSGHGPIMASPADRTRAAVPSGSRLRVPCGSGGVRVCVGVLGRRRRGPPTQRASRWVRPRSSTTVTQVWTRSPSSACSCPWDTFRSPSVHLGYRTPPEGMDVGPNRCSSSIRTWAERPGSVAPL